MAIKTVSLKEEAYGRLKAARRYPGESFSEVVMRATWPEDTTSAGELLATYRTKRRFFSNEELDRIDAVTRGDRPPEDKWAGR
jgi:predicted CopG family antitoxin